MDTPDRPTTLTAHLARAADDRTDGQPPDHAVEATRGDANEGPRCSASVISGQHCRRPAVAGNTLCLGHIAMADSPLQPVATSRKR